MSDSLENENQVSSSRETGAEKRETSRETKSEQEGTVFRGAEMLEEPPGGNSTLGLQTFIAWVKNLVAHQD